MSCGSEGGRRVEAVESEDAVVGDCDDGALHFLAHSIATRRGAGRRTGEGKERKWEQPGAVSGTAALRRSAHWEEEPESEAAVCAKPPIPIRSVFESRDALTRCLPFMQMQGTVRHTAACSAGVRKRTSVCALLRMRAAARRRGDESTECCEMREREGGSTAHTLSHTHRQATTNATSTSERTTSAIPPTAAAPTRASKARIDAATVKKRALCCLRSRLLLLFLPRAAGVERVAQAR